MVKFTDDEDDKPIITSGPTVVVRNDNRGSQDDDVIRAQTESRIVEHQITKEEEHWVKSYWRPAMGWLYMVICIMDFVVFPALTMVLPIVAKNFLVNVQYVPWQSLTLSNGGLIHLAFGAILGVAAWTRAGDKVMNGNGNGNGNGRYR